jgi:hypothetical protein
VDGYVDGEVGACCSWSPVAMRAGVNVKESGDRRPTAGVLLSVYFRCSDYQTVTHRSCVHVCVCVRLSVSLCSSLYVSASVSLLAASTLVVVRNLSCFNDAN